MADNSEIAKEIKSSSRLGLFQRAASYFGFSIKPSEINKDKDDKDREYQLIQTQKLNAFEGKSQSEALKDIEKIALQDMSSSIQDLFEAWMNDTQNTYANIQEREDRLNALTYMADNQSYIKAAVVLTANEVSMVSDNVIFTVLSDDPDWDEQINYLLDKVWKIDEQTIYDLAYDLTLYGEAFQGLEVSSAGIIGMEVLKPNEIVEKMEFKPVEVANFYAQCQANTGSKGFTANLNQMTQSYMQTNTNFQFNQNQKNYISKDELLKDYVENIADVASNEMFKSHLLGYRLPNDMMVAPWQVAHYMIGEHSSEFYPYGCPPLLSCLTAFRQAQRAAGLEDLRKMLSLPFTQYKVKTGGAGMARAFDIVSTVKERFENVGLTQETAGLEGPSLVSNIWTSDDLVTVETSSAGDAGTSEGTVSEQKYLDSKVGICTFVPRTYIDPNSEGFQMSGVALQQMFAPFRTQVASQRKIIRNVIEDLIERHCAIANIKVPDYVLTMNVVNPTDTSQISTKLQNAESVLDAVAGYLNVEKEKLPADIKKDILTKYGDLSPEELKKWAEALDRQGAVEPEVEVDQEDAEAGFGDDIEGEVGDFGGAEDMGGMEEAPAEPTEESAIKRKKNKLVEARYKSFSTDDMIYLITARKRIWETRGCTRTFVDSDHRLSRASEDMFRFFEQHRSTRHGKKKIKG